MPRPVRQRTTTTSSSTNSSSSSSGSPLRRRRRGAPPPPPSPLVLVPLLLLLLLLLLPSSTTPTTALTLVLTSTETRCVFDHLTKDALATGFYSVSRSADDEDRRTGVRVWVTAPDGSDVFAAENAREGKFAFAAAEDGPYETCVRNADVLDHTVVLKLKSGVEAKDLSDVAQRDHLLPLGVELLRIEQVALEVRREMAQFFKSEADMRNVNERTNSLVARMALFSCVVCFLVGAAQFYQVRNFLRKKKVV